MCCSSSQSLQNLFCIAFLLSRYQLVYRNVNQAAYSTSSLVSPWMNVFSRYFCLGVCMKFNYRLLGNFSELKLSIRGRNTTEEVLWKVKNQEESSLWKNGQVFLGFLGVEKRVLITATLKTDNSEANIDNVSYTEDEIICNPLPIHAQAFDTYISDSSSGFLTSPYYPLMYLNNMTRLWEIRVPKDRRIKLNFMFFNLGIEADNCYRDYILIQDGITSRDIARYCGNIIPQDIISPSNILRIRFLSNEKYIFTGFKIRYEAVEVPTRCGNENIFNCPPNVRCNRLKSDNNKIFISAEGLLYMPLYFPERTSAIHFDENLLVKLTKLDFKKLTQLEYLSLRGNKILEIEEETFYNSKSLETLRLSKNRIENIPSKLFHKTRSLKVIDLSMNFIKELKVGLFPSKNKIKVLSLRLNRLKALQNNVFENLQNLQYLYLDSNRLRKIESKVFSGLGDLKVLDLSNNHIEDIPEDLFSPLKSLKTLKVDHFTLCCHAEKAVPGVSCTSLQDSGLSSCDELLKNTFLKYFIWVFGAIACAGNLGVVLWRIIGKDKGQVNSFLLTNLAVADFLMGVYMLMIAYKDTVWRGVYFKHDVSWRASTLCSFAGVLSILSSEVSVLTLCMVTLDRVVCIVFSMRFERISIKKAVIIMIFVWLLGLAISVAPLLNNDYFYDNEQNVNMFGRSGVCLPLQLSVERLAGWEYSVVIFIFLNGISFVYMLVAYIMMYRTVVKSARAAGSTRTNKESTIAKRMMFIVLTAFCCWFPLIVISILCLAGEFHDPKKQVYAWIAVFVLPINSSINPFLYTFSAPQVRDKIATLWPFSKPAAATQRGNAQGTPRVLQERHCKIELKNKALIPAVRKEVVETTSHRKYCIRLLENLELFGCEENITKSFAALQEVKGEEELRLVDVYKNDDENAWRNTTSILSSLCSDGGHRNVLAFLWSGEADKTSCVRDPELPGTSKEELQYDDCLIVYELPSTQTLPDFLHKNYYNLTGNMVVSIAKDLIEAIRHLSSKQIVHNALLPENILIADNMQTSQITAILGGLSAAKFVTSSDEDSDVEQGGENYQDMEELSNDVEAFGYILELLLHTAHFEKATFRLLHDVMDSCFIEDRKSRPTALEVSNQMELVDFDYGYLETRL